MLLTQAEAARRLAISDRMLRQLVAEGRLQYIVVGKRKKFNADAVAQFARAIPDPTRGYVAGDRA